MLRTFAVGNVKLFGNSVGKPGKREELTPAQLEEQIAKPKGDVKVHPIDDSERK